MATRTPRDSGLGRARIQPTASPVDTYSRSNAGSGLSQLAESLKNVAPEVAKYSDVASAQKTEAQKAAGEQKARELFDSGTSYREAIKKGLISPQESPWFQLGAKEQFGRVTAGKFRSALQDAVQNEPGLQESTDVADYDKFVADFKKTWTAENVGAENRDLHFEHGFGSMSDAYSADNRALFVQRAGERQVAQVGERQYQEYFIALDHEISMGTSHTAIAQAITLITDRSIAAGMVKNPRVANMAAVRALGDMVLKTGDVGLFDILKEVKTDKASGSTLYSTVWAQEEIQKVTEKVYVDKQRAHSAAVETEREGRETATRTQMSAIIQRLNNSANPSREDITAEINALSLVNPEAAQTMTRFQDTMTGAKFASNVASVHSTVADIFTIPEGKAGYITVNSLVELVNAREINQQDFAYLKSQLDSRDDAARREANDSKAHNPYTDPQFTHAMSALKQLIGNEFDWKPETAASQNGAVSEFGKYWLEYIAGPGKTATPLEKNKFLIETQQMLAEKWALPDTKSSVKGMKPPVPNIDLRNPAQRDSLVSLLNTVDAQIRTGTGFSPGVLQFFRNNNVAPKDVPAFIASQRSLLPSTK